MKRSFFRHTGLAIAAACLLALTATATATVFHTNSHSVFADDGGQRKIKIAVSLQVGKKGEVKKAKTVQYCMFRSMREAENAATQINAANQRMFSGDVNALEKTMRSLGKSFALSNSNGVVEATAMSGWAFVVYDEEYGAKAVEIKSGQDNFVVTIQSATQVIDEVVKTGKYTSSGPVIKPVPGIDTGDQVTFTVAFELPAGYTTDRSRIICQPMAVDCQTEDTMAYLQPIILEGKDYHVKQDKRMGFDYMKNDSVARGYDPRVVLENDKPVAYSTNVVYKKPDKERIYRGSFYVVLEDFHHKVWDSGTLTTGSCLAFKPLKFLDLSVAAADMPLTSEFQEQAQENLADVKKELDLKFRVGTDDLLNDSANMAKQQAIVKELRSYGTQLWNVEVQGGASPEGSIELNTRLANQRANVAKNILRRHIGSDVRIATKDPRVYTWEDVLNALGKKGVAQDVYDVVKNTIENYKPNEVFGILKGQPFYETEIVPILESMRIMFVQYQYEIKHIMNAEEAVDNYYTFKKDYMSGEKKLSNGDYFNLLATITDSLELDTVTMLAYKHITSQAEYTRLKLAPYVANRMALMLSRAGMPDVNILRPFIDLSRPVNQMDMSDRFNPVKINREQIVLNQAVMYFQEAKLDSALLFIEMLENKKVQLAAASRMRKLVTFQQGYPAYLQGSLTNPKQIEDIREAERYVLNSGDFNRAIIWTELHSQLNKSREDCERLLDRMPDDNPKKWYLKGIIWADEAGKEPQVNDYASSQASAGFRELSTEEEDELMRTDPDKYQEYLKQLDEIANGGNANVDEEIDVSKVPFFLAYFQHSFDMEKKFIRFYRNEGNVNDNVRKQYKYLRKDIPAYRKKFEIIKAAHDRELAEEAGKANVGTESGNTSDASVSDGNEADASAAAENGENVNSGDNQ